MASKRRNMFHKNKTQETTEKVIALNSDALHPPEHGLFFGPSSNTPQKATSPLSPSPPLRWINLSDQRILQYEQYEKTTPSGIGKPASTRREFRSSFCANAQCIGVAGDRVENIAYDFRNGSLGELRPPESGVVCRESGLEAEAGGGGGCSTTGRMIGAMPAVAVRHERRRQEKRQRPSILYLQSPTSRSPTPSPMHSPPAGGALTPSNHHPPPEIYLCGKGEGDQAYGDGYRLEGVRRKGRKYIVRQLPVNKDGSSPVGSTVWMICSYKYHQGKTAAVTWQRSLHHSSCRYRPIFNYDPNSTADDGD
ncbi:hypothetical protein AAG570_005482 [Ranatra chinensis]|uniref:Uncharacterized protein n=1 Tax=Ranatra chinensis TaxID=642074 RepID=A0ABD0XXJ7_9HEMI